MKVKNKINNQNRWLRKRQLKRNKQWMFDFDYIKNLSPEEQEFLNKFIKEYYDVSFKKADPDLLHNTDELRKDCYNRNNASNRDMMSIYNCNGKMDRIEDDQDSLEEEELNSSDSES